MVIQRHAGVHAIFPFLCTFLPPAHDASQEPCVTNAVGVGAPTVALAGVFGLVLIPCTEHEGRDPVAAAVLALGPNGEGNVHLLQAVCSPSQEARPPPAADSRRGVRLYEELRESPGPYADGPDGCGEGDGAFEVNQGNVVIVQAYAGVVEWVQMPLQNIIILLCALLDAQGVFSCRGREEIIDLLKAW